jgi:arabinofuranosyltransferase
MFVLTGASAIAGEAYFSTLFVSAVCSIGVLFVAWRRWRESPHKVFCLAVLFLASKSYLDFTSSGLENPLTHLLLIAFVVVLLGAEADKPITERRLLALVTLSAVAYVNRADTILAYAPALVWLTWRDRRVHRTRLVRIWLAGLIPAIAWTIFGVIYYGFPVPNTAFAKLAGGHYHPPLIHSNAIAYWGNDLRWDPATIPVIVVALAFAVQRRVWKTNRPLACLLVGLLLLLVYATRIGGDYMFGRLFVLPYLIAAITIVELLPAAKPELCLAAAAVPLVVSLFNPRSPLTCELTHAMADRDPTGIIDERALHAIGALRRVMRDKDYRLGVARQFDPQVPQAIVFGAVGFHGYQRGTRFRTIDNLALGDALLARLPARRPDLGWGRGHMFRDIPAGYLASVEMAQNRIVDPSLHEYYDKLLVITTGPIFTAERFRVIWEMNTGKYSHLIDEYASRCTDAGC